VAQVFPVIENRRRVSASLFICVFSVFSVHSGVSNEQTTEHTDEKERNPNKDVIFICGLATEVSVRLTANF